MGGGGPFKGKEYEFSWKSRTVLPSGGGGPLYQREENKLLLEKRGGEGERKGGKEKKALPLHLCKEGKKASSGLGEKSRFCAKREKRGKTHSRGGKRSNSRKRFRHSRNTKRGRKKRPFPVGERGRGGQTSFSPVKGGVKVSRGREKRRGKKGGPFVNDRRGKGERGDNQVDTMVDQGEKGGRGKREKKISLHKGGRGKEDRLRRTSWKHQLLGREKERGGLCRLPRKKRPTSITRRFFPC